MSRAAVKQALIDAGYPEASVYGTDSDPTVDMRDIPPEDVWRAYAKAGLVEACWPCWDAGLAECEERNDCEELGHDLWDGAPGSPLERFEKLKQKVLTGKLYSD